jgi:ribosomal protein S18 acetylase RimI-like enzyme
MPEVRPASIDDVDLVARIGAAGFYDDPVMSWLFQDGARRHEQLGFLFGGLARDMLPTGGTVHLADAASVALWRAPDYVHGRMASDRVQDAIEDSPSPFAADELERLGVLGAAMAASHPHEPHWYLNVASTLPSQQGLGLGAAVLAPVLQICDEEGVRAYLESTNPRNLTFYRRQGFVDAGEIELEGGPRMTAMWREPRG